ncbi:MAG: hypothetical protein Q9160_001723 [Pyrenula sp. 1 TL-2023]
MESVIFEDSPLTSILEGEGNRYQEDERSTSPDTNSTSPVSYAPRGRPSIRERLQKALPRPLEIDTRHQKLGFDRIQNVVTSATNVKSEYNRFLDQFRFILVGSQLLTERGDSTHHRKKSDQRDPHAATTLTTDPQLPFSLEGALIAALIPFAIVWALSHLARQIISQNFDWRDGADVIVPVLALTAVSSHLYAYANRKVRETICRSALTEASRMINAAQGFDSISSTAVTLVSELEVISRGYEFGNQLPPISRLEASSINPYSLRLRQCLASSVSDAITQWTNAHRSFKPSINHLDLEQYYEIYDISRNDVEESISGTPIQESLDRESLRHVRFEMARLFVARKVALCDLLAISSDPRTSFQMTWTYIIEEIKQISTALEKATQGLVIFLEKEEHKHWENSLSSRAMNGANGDCSPSPPTTPGKNHVRMQLRRLDSMSQGIRGLHTKTMLLREEADGTLSTTSESTDMTSLLTKQYDRIGSELRGLLSEWERGKSSMLYNAESTNRRVSMSPNELKSPLSPVYSLGGRTAVEGSPPEALRLLNGDFPHRAISESDTFDEEVFEAVALPPRQRLSMSREEKMARMKEERSRRATLQDKADANTHMLRELETVIKHRPRQRQDPRVTSM